MKYPFWLLFQSVVFGGIFLLTLLAGCKSGPEEVNFKMNEEDYPSFNEQPSADSGNVYKIYSGDTVVFKDISQPEGKVKKRFWDLDTEQIGYEATDTRLTEWVYNKQPAYYPVRLCINDTLDPELCATKWILVLERPFVPAVVEEPPVKPHPEPAPRPAPAPKPAPEPRPAPAPRKPEIKFTLPNVYSTNTQKQTHDITVRVANASRNDLTLEVNGTPQGNFDLSKGQLRARVSLREGENIVKLTANVPGQEAVSEKRVFIYTPPAVPVPALQFMQPARSATTTESDKYDITIATTNVSKKDQLSITVGGQPFTGFDFSAKKGEVTAKVPLKPGDNTIRVTTKTNYGEDVKEVVITYNKRTVDDVLPNLGAVGIPLSSYPSSKDCIDLLRNAFSVTLTPARDVELQNFRVYTDDCGGITVTLSGPQLKETFKAAINAGRSQVSFGDVNARLKAGQSYTLTCTPIAGYGGCSSKNPPAFQNLRDCDGVNSASTQALKLDTKGSKILFDLKYLY